VCRLLPYREELEWPEKAWRRFEREIYPFVEGRPNPEDLLKEQEEEMKANPTKPLQRMVVMMGVPGSGNPLLVVDAVVSVARCLTSLSLSLSLSCSVLVNTSGKSTLAKRLIDAYPEFVRVNQDEMKTRRRCEAEAEIGLRRGKSVLVDRCNFDFQQRVTWIKLGTYIFSSLSLSLSRLPR
jgi:hypothetical protein